MAMHRLDAGMRLVVASHNKGKVYEIKHLIKPYGLDAVSAADLDLPEPEETETTFAGNARLKAVAAATASGLPALADDSGLEVDALGGAPGIFSARWAGPSKDFAVAMEKVATEVKSRHGWSAPGPRANFICALCLAWPDGSTDVFEGKVFGHLVWPPRGGNGFGYDPMFLADGEDLTFGEMAPDRKHALSHRARAFDLFEAACLSGLSKADPSGPKASDAAEGLEAAAANLSTRPELAAFIGYLRADLQSNPEGWETTSLEPFLEAMQAWLNNTDTVDGIEPKWRAMAQTLLSARNPPGVQGRADE